MADDFLKQLVRMVAPQEYERLRQVNTDISRFNDTFDVGTPGDFNNPAKGQQARSLVKRLLQPSGPRANIKDVFDNMTVDPAMPDDLVSTFILAADQHPEAAANVRHLTHKPPMGVKLGDKLRGDDALGAYHPLTSTVYLNPRMSGMQTPLGHATNKSIATHELAHAAGLNHGGVGNAGANIAGWLAEFGDTAAKGKDINLPDVRKKPVKK